MTTTEPVGAAPAPVSAAGLGRTPGRVALPARRVRRLRWVLRGYVALTKPRIIELLLVTTVPTMILADGGMPPLGRVLLTLVGGAGAAGSANALNCYLDRDIDAVMRRTVNRPLATGQVTPRGALLFGLGLGAAAVALFAFAVNLLAAALALGAILFYVVGYTLVLKRRTPQNIVWGGAAGCMPVLIGWAAVRGSLDWAPVVLFGVIFLWTPPHYWPLSMRFRDDYAAAGVPMLPVVATASRVAGEIVRYSWAMVACSLLLVPVAGMGWGYAAVALALGAYFLREAHGLRGRVRTAAALVPSGPMDAASLARLGPMRLFHASITYLSLLFAAVAVDPFLPF